MNGSKGLQQLLEFCSVVCSGFKIPCVEKFGVNVSSLESGQVYNSFTQLNTTKVMLCDFPGILLGCHSGGSQPPWNMSNSPKTATLGRPCPGILVDRPSWAPIWQPHQRAILDCNPVELFRWPSPIQLLVETAWEIPNKNCPAEPFLNSLTTKLWAK